MTEKHPLTSEEISTIVYGFDPIDWEEAKLLKAMPQTSVILSRYERPKRFAQTFATN